FAQSLFHSRPFGYVVRHAKDDPLLSRPGDGPEHIHKAPILANVTIHKIGDFAARQQAFRGRFRYGPIFFEYEIDVTATHQLLSRVAPESFASGVHTQEAALLVDRADHILRFVHDELVRVEGRLQLAAALLERGFGGFTLGNILDHQEKMKRLAFFVADDAGRPAYPKDAAILVDVTFVACIT